MTERRDFRPLQLFVVALDYAALAVLALIPADLLPAAGAPPEDSLRDVRLLITGAGVVIAGGLNLYLAMLRRGAWRLGNIGLALALAGLWSVKFLLSAGPS